MLCRASLFSLGLLGPLSSTLVAKSQTTGTVCLQTETRSARSTEEEVLDFGAAQDMDKPALFTNMGKVVSGYNIYQGNPMPTAAGVDPGIIGRPLFDMSYAQGQKTGDMRHLVPDGYSVTKVVGCSLNFASKVISSNQDYEESLKSASRLSVSVAVPGKGGGSFSASSDSQNYRNMASSKNVKKITSTADCAAYKAVLRIHSPPTTSEDFQNAYNSLGNENSYFRLFTHYGTHFLTAVQMGSRFGYTRYISEAAWNSVAEDFKSTSIEAAASAQATAASGDASASQSDSREVKAGKKFAENMESMQVVTLGKVLKKGETAAEWAERSTDEPMPIKYDMELICYHPVFTDDKKRTKCKNNLKKYCESYLKKFHPAVLCEVQNTEECAWDIDCGQKKVCREKVCIPEPECTVTIFKDDGYQGQSRKLDPVVKSMENGNSGYEISLGSSWADSVSSIKLGPGCEKVMLVDDDGSGDDQCAVGSTDNTVTREDLSEIPFDLENDVCKVVVWAKTV